MVLASGSSEVPILTVKTEGSGNPAHLKRPFSLLNPMVLASGPSEVPIFIVKT